MLFAVQAVFRAAVVILAVGAIALLVAPFHFAAHGVTRLVISIKDKM